MIMQFVNSYSLQRDGSLKLPDEHGHFHVYEFACSDGSDTIFISWALVNVLEQIRMHFGKAVHINSGYRTERYNKSLQKASKFSQHMYGTAADIWIEGVPQRELAQYARELLPHSGGVGIYNTFVHVDVREDKRDWVL